MSEQSAFNVTRKIIHEDHNKKWVRFKKKLQQLQAHYKEGTILNEISNEALIDKILKMMERYEKDE